MTFRDVLFASDGSRLSRADALDRWGARAVEIAEIAEAVVARPAMVLPLSIPKRVFISYRWGSDAESAWVARVAAELRGRGYEVVLDQFERSESDEANVGDRVPRGMRLVTPEHPGSVLDARRPEQLRNAIDKLFPRVDSVPSLEVRAKVQALLRSSDEAASHWRSAEAYTMACEAVALWPGLVEGCRRQVVTALRTTRFREAQEAAMCLLNLDSMRSLDQVLAALTCIEIGHPEWAARLLCPLIEVEQYWPQHLVMGMALVLVGQMRAAHLHLLIGFRDPAERLAQMRWWRWRKLGIEPGAEMPVASEIGWELPVTVEGFPSSPRYMRVWGSELLEPTDANSPGGLWTPSFLFDVGEVPGAHEWKEVEATILARASMSGVVAAFDFEYPPAEIVATASCSNCGLSIGLTEDLEWLCGECGGFLGSRRKACELGHVTFLALTAEREGNYAWCPYCLRGQLYVRRQSREGA